MTGTALLDFGAFPGGSNASVAVTGQVGIVAGSLVEAWLMPAATADHTADEHVVETIRVMAGNITPSDGFVIYGVNTSQLNEPVVPRPRGPVHGLQQPTGGGCGTRLSGKWNVAWVWA